MSLMWMLRIVAFFAVGCAALARPTAPWLAATVTAMFVLVIVATIQSLSSGRPRHFALGFTIAAWVYILLLAVGVEHMLVTTWISQRGYAIATGRPIAQQDYAGIRRINGDQVAFVSQQDRRQSEALMNSGIPGGMMGGPGMMMSGSMVPMGMGMSGGMVPMGTGMGMSGNMMGVSGMGGGMGGYGGGIPPMDSPTLSSFSRYMHVTHSMWAVLWASLFGIIAARGGPKESKAAAEVNAG